MKKRDLVCILCPNGCQVKALVQQTPDLKVLEVKGCTCDKGIEWVEQEIINPMRTIASSIVVEKGDFKLVSVRTDTQIPLGKIFDVMDAIKKKKVTAPVKIGDKLIEKPCGIPCNIIATRNVTFL
jgi:CxxC motif-containing protein